MRRNDCAAPERTASKTSGVAVLLRRVGHTTIRWSAVAAVTAFCSSPTVAFASSHHHAAAHSAHGHSRPATLKSTRSASRHHERQARARGSVGATREPSPVHRDVAPLANTVWDNPKIPAAVLSAIQVAAHESGVDPDLLAAVAWRESRFDPTARNRNSSAKGLLQFTNATWLQMIRDYGPDYNQARYANTIRKDKSGALVVSGKHVRTAILQLRSDPVLSAKFAAANMRRERGTIQERLGRGVVPADLYLLHVLGPTGTIRFLTAVSEHPSDSSTDVANLKVLRNAGLLASDGRPLTVAATYQAIQAMLDARRSHTDTASVPAAPEPIEVSAAP